MEAVDDRKERVKAYKNAWQLAKYHHDDAFRERFIAKVHRYRDRLREEKAAAKALLPPKPPSLSTAEKYRADPEFREKMKAYMRARNARVKEAKQAVEAGITNAD